MTRLVALDHLIFLPHHLSDLLQLSHSTDIVKLNLAFDMMQLRVFMFGIFQSILKFLYLILEGFYYFFVFLIFIFLILDLPLKRINLPSQLFFLFFEHIFHSIELLFINLSRVSFRYLPQLSYVSSHFLVTFHQLLALTLPLHQLFFNVLDMLLLISYDVP